ncbi:MAG: hypothetical protein AAF481_03430 [Acidobacteriota bacterium]
MRAVRGGLQLLLVAGLLAVGGTAWGKTAIQEDGSRWRGLAERVVEALFGSTGDEEPTPEDGDGGGGMIDPNG